MCHTVTDFQHSFLVDNYLKVFNGSGGGNGDYIYYFIYPGWYCSGLYGLVLCEQD